MISINDFNYCFQLLVSFSFLNNNASHDMCFLRRVGRDNPFFVFFVMWVIAMIGLPFFGGFRSLLTEKIASCPTIGTNSQALPIVHNMLYKLYICLVFLLEIFLGDLLWGTFEVEETTNTAWQYHQQEKPSREPSKGCSKHQSQL